MVIATTISSIVIIWNWKTPGGRHGLESNNGQDQSDWAESGLYEEQDWISRKTKERNG